MYISFDNKMGIIQRELAGFSNVKIIDSKKFIEISQKLGRKAYRDLIMNTNSQSDLNKFSEALFLIFGKTNIGISFMQDYSEIEFLSKEFIKDCILKNKYPESVLQEVEFKITKKKLEKVYMYKLVEALDNNPDNQTLKWNESLPNIKNLYRDNKSATEIRNIANSGIPLDFSLINSDKIKLDLYSGIAKEFSRRYNLVKPNSLSNNEFYNLLNILSLSVSQYLNAPLKHISQRIENEFINKFEEIMFDSMLLKDTLDFELRVTNLDELYSEFSEISSKKSEFLKGYRIKNKKAASNLAEYFKRNNYSENDKEMFFLHDYVSQTDIIQSNSDLKDFIFDDYKNLGISISLNQNTKLLLTFNEVFENFIPTEWYIQNPPSKLFLNGSNIL